MRVKIIQPQRGCGRALTAHAHGRNVFITVTGQTAPGDGIYLKGGGLNIRTHDAIIRFIRVRPGIDRGSIGSSEGC
jgi:hypothetical protein